ncbi:MAG: ion transporter [Bacteroidota bacterium]|nr:ion transporter [Bacteroidota bacterium]
MEDYNHLSPWRQKIHEVIYEADTPAGKLFDVLLLILIFISVLGIILESVESIRLKYGDILILLEWTVTVIFTIEYILRIISIGKPFKYIFSFFGLVDLVAFLPAYIALIWIGAYYFSVIRMFRLLRIFRIFKLAKYTWASKVLMLSLRQNKGKIIIFLMTVFTIVTIMGSLLYAIEGPKHGFVSIPVGIYWAIITLTTVGYGDIVPATPIGKLIASAIMIMGYSIIAVPTGLVSMGIASANKKEVSNQACHQCSKEGHDVDALHCKYCGAVLNPLEE